MLGVVPAKARATFQPPRSTSLRVRARHEAGHCVVAIALGWRPARVGIVESRDRDGEIAYHRRPRWSPYDPVERGRRLAVLFAGAEAERIVSRASIFTTLMAAGAGDLDRVCAILDESYGPWADAPAPFRRMREAEEEAARKRARDTLKSHWSAVQALAAALVRRRNLTGPQAFRIATRRDAALLRSFHRARRRSRSRSDAAVGPR